MWHKKAPTSIYILLYATDIRDKRIKWKLKLDAIRMMGFLSYIVSPAQQEFPIPFSIGSLYSDDIFFLYHYVDVVKKTGRRRPNWIRFLAIQIRDEAKGLRLRRWSLNGYKIDRERCSLVVLCSAFTGSDSTPVFFCRQKTTTHIYHLRMYTSAV